MAKKLTGTDLIRAALEAGVTKPTAIIVWVKEHHGKSVKNSLINNVKQRVKAESSKAPPKKTGKSRTAKAEAIVAPSVAQSTEEAKTHSDMIRDALNGGILKPREVIAWVKETFGVEVGRGLVNQVKHKWAHPRRAKAKPKAKSAETHAAPRPAASPSGSIIGDIVTVKELLARHGKDGLSKLVEIL